MTKILVIEDESILRTEVMEWLSLEGYEVYGASTGKEGVRSALFNEPDLIICDITMPELDGYGVLVELRSNLETATVPFIFVTARASHDDIRRGMTLGADDYITKPFTRSELFDAVHTRLERKALEEERLQQETEHWQQAFHEEHEQRILKAKLIAMFSHDFRNPLTTILTSNSLLRDYSDRMDKERRLRHFNRIDASVNQLIQMLDDMLTVSQLETNNFALEREQMVVQECVTAIVDEFRGINGNSHQISFASEYNGIAMIDPRLLRQILANLLSNAIKYSPKGRHVYIELDSHNDNEIILRVQDEGIGIPEEEQHMLFQPYQRASNVGDIQGTGLGLEIVRQAVDLHGGKVEFQSTVNVGTTFTVTLPIK